METFESNERLTRVGAGTPMGELLRRYWWPVAARAELTEEPTRAVQILGERLVLYRDTSGAYGLIGERCAHRNVNLVFGMVESDGIRCPYHGWKYDGTGQCLEMPAEDPDKKYHERIKLQSYPVQELGGLLWAYLGPAPAPLLPRWDLLVMDNVFRQIGQAVVPCNWLQCMENSADSIHAEYLHGHFFKYVLQRQGIQPTNRVIAGMRHHVKTEYERSQYGITKKRLRAGDPEDAEDWKTGHPLVFPYMVRLGGAASGRYELQIRVPLSDTETWHLSYQCYDPGPQVVVPRQEVVPIFETPMKDERGRYIFDYVLAQDLVAWWAQGEITDRTNETLMPSDRGVVLFRRMLKEQMDIVAAGGDPINTFRDAAQNVYLRLSSDPTQLTADDERGLAANPMRKYALDDLPTGTWSPWLEEIRQLFEKAEAASGRSRSG